MLWKHLVAFAVLGVALGAAPSRAGADPFIIDQQSSFSSPTSFLIFPSANSVFGQEFTPALTSLHDVELELGGPTGHPDATVMVSILTGGPTGTLLGSTSILIPTSDASTTIRHFDFSSSVSLTPTNLYFIDATIDQSNFSVAADYNNPYPSGRAYYNGTFTHGSFGDNVDLSFREGPNISAVPEPSTGLLLGTALPVLLGISRCALRRSRVSILGGGPGPKRR
jgi:hypothetical protein